MNFLLITLFSKNEYPELFKSSRRCTVNHVHRSRGTRMQVVDIISTSGLKITVLTDHLSLMGQLKM